MKFPHVKTVVPYLKLLKYGISPVPQSLWRTFSARSFSPFYTSFFKNYENIAVHDNHGDFKYKDILNSSFILAKEIKKLLPKSKQNGERITFLCANDATYATILLSCWITGNAAVPLCSAHPRSLLEYYIKDSQSNLVIANKEFVNPMEGIAKNLNTPFMTIEHGIYSSALETQSNLLDSEFYSWDSQMSPRRALIIYTSGTTGPPKGVVLTHGNLHSQVSAVVDFWKISSNDSILHALPLHHIHGIMNALLCPLSVGGKIVMQHKFNAIEAWNYFFNTDAEKPRVNLFFAVPTMYAKLAEQFDNFSKSGNYTKERCSQNMRLFCSGSMALPEPLFHRWEEITGQRLVERFGMSEIGMALSNPLEGPRLPGSVGVPLPEVEVKIRKYDAASPESYSDLVTANFEEIKVLPGSEEESGELLVKGPNVFKEYFNREKATFETFTEDGWFKTGDTACFKNGAFTILGRTSVDIIKSGGYKISALEVESCILRHPDVAECTVFGLADEMWGERVATLIKFNQGKSVNDDDMKAFCKKYLPKYAVPTVIRHVDLIPRNVLGKVNKKELKKNFN